MIRPQSLLQLVQGTNIARLPLQSQPIVLIHPTQPSNGQSLERQLQGVCVWRAGGRNDLLKPAAGGAIRNALVSGGDVPLPEERYDLIVKGIGAVGLEDDTGIGSLFDRRLGHSLPPVSDVSLTLPSSIGAAGATWGLEIALGYSSFQRVGSRGTESQRRLGIGN
ncbi:hypothetical protein HO133_001088 [Letharia lupina]|uniref:Uncharacterized protein n=1 Tax=Letharia lupina TaxID=560253 RepID=A0A8H6CH23_9LECA|nr:uncharacterized protein HO133_001088 [Letharia lupina]KAF6223036.1 hypothetical protein HO133_001088 [Letharia lupina]